MARGEHGAMTGVVILSHPAWSVPIMPDLVVIAFPSEEAAESVRHRLLELQKEYLIELGDAVVAVKQPNGKVKLNQLVNPTTAGAVSGTFWGALVGLVFLMPFVGAAIGAASGALSGAPFGQGVAVRPERHLVPVGRRVLALRRRDRRLLGHLRRSSLGRR